MGCLIKRIVPDDIISIYAADAVCLVTKFHYIVFGFTFLVQDVVAHAASYERVPRPNRFTTAAA